MAWVQYSDLRGGALTLLGVGLPIPGGGELVTKLSFSDETRMFAQSRAGLAEGDLVCGLGVLPMTRGSIQFDRLPLLMGDSPDGVIAKVVGCLRLIAVGLACLQPAHVLALRILLGYAVSVLDF